jgi:hypothetical protein
MVKHTYSMRQRGDFVIYPGMEKMAELADATDRTARSNMRILENWGVAIPVANAKGGGGSTRFTIDLKALFKALVAQGCNPSEHLRAELCRSLVEARGNVYHLPNDNSRAQHSPQVRNGGDPGKNPGNISAGSIVLIGGAAGSKLPPLKKENKTAQSAVLSSHDGSCVFFLKSLESHWEQFRKIFPRNSKRDLEFKAFSKAVEAGSDPNAIIDAAKRYAKHREGEDSRYTKASVGWLNDQRWTDEDLPELPIEDTARKFPIGSPEDIAERRARLLGTKW